MDGHMLLVMVNETVLKNKKKNGAEEIVAPLENPEIINFNSLTKNYC